MAAKLLEIFIAPERRAPMISLDQAEFVAGRGIEGDRYFHGKGSFSRWPGPRRELSLIAAEALDALQDQHGIVLSPGAHRRNLVILGLPAGLIEGSQLSLGGAVTLRLEGPCAPCRYLERLSAPGIFEALKILGGGWRASILSGGAVETGAVVALSN